MASGIRGTALTLVVVGLLSACGDSDGSAAPSSAERPAVRVDESLGVLRVPAGDPLRIGLVLDSPDSDELAAVLEAASRAALEDFGPVQQGFRAQIDPAVDAGCDRSTASAVAERLADDVLLSAVLGPQCAVSLLGLQGPLAAAGLVVIASRPTDATLTATPQGGPAEDRSDGMWRTSPTRLDEARAAAAFAFDQLDARRAAILDDGSTESTALAAAFRASFELLGGTVVAAATIDAGLGGDVGGDADGDADGDAEADEADEAARRLLAETLGQVAEARPDVAFLPLSAGPLLTLAEAWDDRAALRGVERLTGSLAATSAFLDEPFSEGHLIVVPVLRFSDATSSVTGMSATQVEERVASLSGVRTPSGWWAYAYDATTLLLRALEDVSIIDNDGSLVISRSELRATLARLAFAGITGDIACDGLGDCSSRRFEVHRHQDASSATLSERTLIRSATVAD